MSHRFIIRLGNCFTVTLRRCFTLRTAQAFVTCLLLTALSLSTPATRAEVPLKQVSQADYLAGYGRLQALVAACQARPAACESTAVGDDLRVTPGSPAQPYTVRWNWLRNALDSAKDARLEDRSDLLAQAQARLVADHAEALTVNPSDSSDPQALAAQTANARARADAILRGSEFSRVRQQGYLEQKLALLRLWLDRLLMGAAILVPHSPWVGLALEWGALALAAAGLIAWAFRVGRQQRVALAPIPESAGWQQESDNWAERARLAAAAGDWREAVHCLYWAAIVMLEGQRLWRANRARTPREYVRLLEPGSPKRTALTGLTTVFERIWYGLRPAAEQDYRQAESLLGQLRNQPGSPAQRPATLGAN